MTPDQYRSLYLAPIRPPAGAPPVAITLAPQHYYLPRGQARPSPTLQELFEAGVACGHAESLAQLESRVHLPDAELAALRQSQKDLADFGRAHVEHVRHLENAVKHAREVVLEYQNSTFWRITLPLRWISHRAKLAVRAVRGLRHSLSLLPARMSIARQILKDEGAVHLSRRVWQKLSGAQRISFAPARDYRVEAAVHALAFPEVAEPELTIVIPVYGHHATRSTACAASPASRRWRASRSSSWTTPPGAGRRGAGRRSKGVRFLRAVPTSASSPAAISARRRRGANYLVLPTTTPWSRRLAEAMLDTFRLPARRRPVGAKLLYPDGKPAGGRRHRLARRLGVELGPRRRSRQPRLQLPERGRLLFRRLPRAAHRDCCRLGGFDRAYAPAYYEDTDFASGCGSWANASITSRTRPSSTSRASRTAPRRPRASSVTRWSTARSSWRAGMTCSPRHRVNGGGRRWRRPRGRRAGAGGGSLHDHARPRLRLGAHAGLLDSWWDGLQGELRRRQPASTSSPMWATCSGRGRGPGPPLRRVRRAAAAGARRASSTWSCSARHYIAARFIDAVRKHAPQALHRPRHPTTCTTCARGGSPAGEQQGARAERRLDPPEGDRLHPSRRCDLVVSPVEQEVLAHEVPQAPRASSRPTSTTRRRRRPRTRSAKACSSSPASATRRTWTRSSSTPREIAPAVRERLPGVKTQRRRQQRAAVGALASPPTTSRWSASCPRSSRGSRAAASRSRRCATAPASRARSTRPWRIGVPVVATAPSVEGHAPRGGRGSAGRRRPARLRRCSGTRLQRPRDLGPAVARGASKTSAATSRAMCAREAIASTFANVRRP